MPDQPSNLVDFTLLRLKKLRQEYFKQKMYDVVASIEHAITLYSQGRADVKWKDGYPYLKVIDKQDKID